MLKRMGEHVKLFNAGEDNQSSLWRRDGNAYHFSTAYGIRFGRNGNWASSPGILDAIMRWQLQALLYGQVIHRSIPS